MVYDDVDLSFLRIKHRRKGTDCKRVQSGEDGRARTGAAPEDAPPENATVDFGGAGNSDTVLDEVQR